MKYRRMRTMNVREVPYEWTVDKNGVETGINDKGRDEYLDGCESD